MVVVGGFWAHSGAVQYHAKFGRYLYQQTADIRANWFEHLLAPTSLKPAQEALVERATHYVSLAHRWGLLHDGQTDLQLAWLCLLSGRNESAEGHMVAALERLPDNANIRFDFGNFLSAQRRFGEAIEMYRQALALQPDLVGAHLNLGMDLAAMGRLDDARQAYRRGIEVDPTAAEVHYNLGVAAAMQGDLPTAVEAFRTAVRLRPDLREAQHNLAGALCSQGRFDEGIVQYEALLARWPDDADARYLLGLACLETEQVDEAETQFQWLLDHAPERPEGHRGMAAVCRLCGDVESARQHERRARERDTRPTRQQEPGEPHTTDNG
jgi:tetratricopeptide (TPR) repeat protein